MIRDNFDSTIQGDLKWFQVIKLHAAEAAMNAAMDVGHSSTLLGIWICPTHKHA